MMIRDEASVSQQGHRTTLLLYRRNVFARGLNLLGNRQGTSLEYRGEKARSRAGQDSPKMIPGTGKMRGG